MSYYFTLLPVFLGLLAVAASVFARYSYRYSDRQRVAVDDAKNALINLPESKPLLQTYQKNMRSNGQKFLVRVTKYEYLMLKKIVAASRDLTPYGSDVSFFKGSQNVGSSKIHRVYLHKTSQPKQGQRTTRPTCKTAC